MRWEKPAAVIAMAWVGAAGCSRDVSRADAEARLKEEARAEKVEVVTRDRTRLDAKEEVRGASEWRARAERDLAAARVAAGRLTEPEAWLEAHEELLAAALRRDVREAVAWVKGLKPVELAAVLMDQALAPWVGVDPQAAGAHVAALGESDYRTALAGEVAGAWVRRDASAATAWSASLGDQEAREEALRVVIGAVAEAEPRRAAELALRVPGEGDRAVALEQVVEAWWARDAAALLAWAAALPDGEGRERIARLVEAQREAPPAAGEMTNGL